MTRRGDGFTCVTQYDHGALAGQLAARWGNERFAAAALAAALEIAATHHDDGWRELDDLPAVNEDDTRPAHFLELPLERTAPPYGRGVDSVYARDPLAGALAAMHWTGLYSARWGLQNAGGPRRSPLASRVVSEQERRRLEVLREVWDFRGPRGEFDADVWHAYEILQTLDVASLALSLTDPAAPTDPAAEPLPITAVLTSVEQPPGARVLPAAPAERLGARVDLAISVTAPGEASFDPWPFEEEEFELELPARSVPASLDPGEAAAAYRAAVPEPLRWYLRAP